MTRFFRIRRRTLIRISMLTYNPSRSCITKIMFRISNFFGMITHYLFIISTCTNIVGRLESFGLKSIRKSCCKLGYIFICRFLPIIKPICLNISSKILSFMNICIFVKLKLTYFYFILMLCVCRYLS